MEGASGVHLPTRETATVVNRLHLTTCGVLLIALSPVPTRLSAQTGQTGAALDRWMYPFNASPGVRPIGSTFGAIQNPAFDDLDAQVLLGFDTASTGIPTGAGADQYQISAATVRLTTSTDGAFVLDNSYDPFGTYLDPSQDDDAGRPVELYGMGFRNGFLSATLTDGEPGPPLFEEDEAFGIPGPPAPEIRHAYASDYAAGTARDVSNHVRNGFDPTPWAIADLPGTAAGTAVPVDSDLQFQIDVANPDILAQLQAGLDEGQLFFTAVSRHTSTQGSNEGIPSFYLGGVDGGSLGPRASLQLDYEVIPEPTAGWLLVMGLIGIGQPVRRRNR